MEISRETVGNFYKKVLKFLTKKSDLAVIIFLERLKTFRNLNKNCSKFRLDRLLLFRNRNL